MGLEQSRPGRLSEYIIYRECIRDVGMWRTDPLYCQFYYESGLIWVDGTAFTGQGY